MSHFSLEVVRTYEINVIQFVLFLVFFYYRFFKGDPKNIYDSYQKLCLYK